MHRSISKICVLLTGILLIALPVFAHEGREVGDYELIFGWRNEPAVSNQINGPELFISLHGSAQADPQAALEALDIQLQAEISFGPESTILLLTPARPYYSDGALHLVADLIPTLPGDYSFRITGTIGDVAVDETFSSASGEFSSVEPASDIQFPRAGIVDLSALMEQIAALEARVAELEAAAGS